MDNLTTARHARKKSQTSATNAKLDQSWKQWELFLQRIEYTDNEFLDDINKSGCIKLLGAFAQSIHNHDFQDRVRRTWQEQGAKMPWIKWLRPLGQTIGATPTMALPM